jgi:hypothetical protein
MNSNFYEQLRVINLCRAKFLPEQLADLEQAYKELEETLKSNQLNRPETFKAYCLAAFEQINTKHESLRKQFRENEAKPDFIKYRSVMLQILSAAFSAETHILEYLAVYSPETFSGFKPGVFTGDIADQLWTHLPSTSPHYQKVEKFLQTNNQQPKEVKHESGTTTTNRNEDGILRKDKTGKKYPSWLFALTDYLLRITGSSKAQNIDLTSKIIIEQYSINRYGVDLYPEYRKLLKNIQENKDYNWNVYINSMPSKYLYNNEWKKAVLDICDNDNVVKLWLKKYSS